MAGSGVWWAHAEEDLRRLVEVAPLPLNVNGMARGVLPPGHPLFFPRARGAALGEADLILVIGVPLDFRLNWGQPPVFADGAGLVFLDVDDQRKHKTPDVAIYGDLKATLAALAVAAETPERTEWLALLPAAEGAAPAPDAAMTGSDSSPVHPPRLIAEGNRDGGPGPSYLGDGG